MTQILPMLDEETEAELMPIHASFLDPYILLVRNDYSAVVLKADARGEFDEVSCGGHFSSKTWRSGSIHGMSTEKSDAMLYMLSNEGHLYVEISFPKYHARSKLIENLRCLRSRTCHKVCTMLRP